MNAHAKLSIHSERADLSIVENSLERLRALCVRSHPRNVRMPLNLRVEDLQGIEWFSMPDVGLQVDLLLPAGTYSITAVMGHLRRSYTMTLQPGVTFELHLPTAMSRH